MMLKTKVSTSDLIKRSPKTLTQTLLTQTVQVQTTATNVAVAAEEPT